VKVAVDCRGPNRRLIRLCQSALTASCRSSWMWTRWQQHASSQDRWKTGVNRRQLALILTYCGLPGLNHVNVTTTVGCRLTGLGTSRSLCRHVS